MKNAQISKGNHQNEDNIGITYTSDLERHSIAYGIDRAAYNMGQNAQFNITVKEEIEPTMVAKGPGRSLTPFTAQAKIHIIQSQKKIWRIHLSQQIIKIHRVLRRNRIT